MRTTVLAVLGLAASVSAQATLMPIPAYTSTFSSATATRGFWFQSPANIVITALNVPDETGQGTQNVELFDLGGAAPPAFPTTVNGTQLFYAANQPAGTPIPTNIVVNNGDYIGVLGACGTGTMANSYGAAGPFTSSILGQPVQIDRLLTQFNINTTGGNQPLSAEPGGSISRVEIYYVPAQGLFPEFQADVTSGPSPLTVNFTDLSFTSDPAGIIAWLWDVDNDGNVDYQTQNCTHTYTQCGVYDVSLQVVDAQHGISPPLIKTAYIDVDPISGAFTYSSLGNNAVQFTDTTVGAVSWAWDFDNDGTVDSTQQSPQHTYPASGFYTCSLTVSNGCNNDTVTQQVPTFGLITTTFVGGNGLGTNAGNYFDVNVLNPNGITVTGLEVSALTAATGFVDVYTIPNTYVGNEQNQAAWTLVSSTQGVTLTGGYGTRDFVDCPDFFLPQGNYGLYVQTAGGVAYTNGNGTNQAYANGDLSLTLGASSTAFGAPITPRVWNGSIYYDVGGVGVYSFHKNGCAGSAGVTTNVAAPGSAPLINTTFSVNLSPLPASNTAIMVFGIDDTNWNGSPLPLNAGPFGAPGCFLNVAPESTSLVIGSGGSGTWNLPIPNNANFIGTRFFTQALVIDPINGLGGVASDSATGVVGQ